MIDKRYTFERGPARRNIERLLALIANESLTEPELAEKLNLSMPAIRPYILHLKQNRMIHITSWNRQSVAGMRAFPRPRYRAGPGINHVKPKPKSKKEIAKDYRRRVLSNPERYPEGYRKMRADRAKQELRLANLRKQKLAESGFNPHTVGMAGRIFMSEKKRTPTPAQVEKIINLREKGMYWKDISAATGVPKSTARTHYRLTMGIE